MGQKLDYDGIVRVFPEIAEIQNEAMRKTVAELWIDIAAEMPWNSLQEIPKNSRGEEGRDLVTHIRAVTQMAVAICDIAKKLHGKEFDRDAMLAGGLLHDLSKPIEYEPDPERKGDNKLRPSRRSRIGRNIQHAVYAAHKMLSKGMSPEMVHLIITHTHASNRRGTSWEAAALFYGDFADSDAGLHSAKDKMYSERWKL